MELTEVFSCPCNPTFNYKNKTSFNAHKKSNRHITYESRRKEEKIQATKLSNQRDLIERMYEKTLREKINLENQVAKLIEENNILRNKLSCLSKSLSDVCSPENLLNSSGDSNDTKQ
jgi:hypothetical protein